MESISGKKKGKRFALNLVGNNFKIIFFVNLHRAFLVWL